MKTKILLLAFIALIAQFSFAQDSKYLLSSHILDINKGKPAANVKVVLSKLDKENTWTLISEKKTDTNGRINGFIEKKNKNKNGVYKLTFYTNPYFKEQGINSFYPFIDVVFEITDDTHYHVPITVSPFGYSTYRGS